jgi:hypothetical protein
MNKVHAFLLCAEAGLCADGCVPGTLLADTEDRTCEAVVELRGVAVARGVAGTPFSGATGIRDAPKRCVLSDKRLRLCGVCM